MAEPKISVVIPTHNRAFCVGEAIESCLRQDVSDLEVVVVDDASTDNTTEVVQSFGQRVRYLRIQHSGVAVARNVGILCAQGEWVSLLDDDDELLPGSLSLYVKNLCRHPYVVAHLGNVELIGKDYTWNTFDLRGLVLRDEPTVLSRPLRDVLGDAYSHESALFRRDIGIQAGLYDPNLVIHEDFDFLARLALQGPFLATGRIVARCSRKGDPHSSLSDRARRDLVASPQSLAFVFEKLLSSGRLCRQERSIVRKKLATYLAMWAWAEARQTGRLDRRKLFRSALLRPLSSTAAQNLLLLCMDGAALPVLGSLKKWRAGDKGSYKRSNPGEVKTGRTSKSRSASGKVKPSGTESHTF